MSGHTEKGHHPEAMPTRFQSPESAQPSDFTREASRDILRAAVFLWNTPLVTPRISSGWAARSAVEAASLSPEAIASSTLRRQVRMRERRALLTAWRFSFWRARFLDWIVLAMGV